MHSLSSDQVFLSIQLKTFSKFSGWTFKFFLALVYSLFLIPGVSKNVYKVNQAKLEIDKVDQLFLDSTQSNLNFQLSLNCWNLSSIERDVAF